MKHRPILIAALSMFLLSCGGNQNAATSQPSAAEPPHDTIASEPATAQIALHPEAHYDSNSTFIVVSKQDTRLTVYARSNQGDTIALASYPACMGKNRGDKQAKGDMRTPESPAGRPFSITMIQDASTWHHDFGDGRGSILAYGHWFLRLDTPGHSGIGIHGSTGNENTVPGRASEGCIRLLDKDIISLKENYARVGMPVIVKGEQQGLLPFERRCVAMP